MNNLEFTQFINSMLGSITTQQVLNVLTAVIGIGMIFFLMWFGVHYIIDIFTYYVSGGEKGGEKALESFLKHEELREALITNSAYSEATMKTIGPSGIPIGKPIEPMEPHPERITPKQKKDAEEWFATHDSFGHELGYDKREWENYYKKNNYKYKKKYNNYKKNYYYDSHGNKYYK